MHAQRSPHNGNVGEFRAGGLYTSIGSQALNCNHNIQSGSRRMLPSVWMMLKDRVNIFDFINFFCISDLNGRFRTTLAQRKIASGCRHRAAQHGTKPRIPALAFSFHAYSTLPLLITPPPSVVLVCPAIRTNSITII